VKYAVVYEKSLSGYAAYVPDLPGYVAAADTRAEAERLIRESIRLHLRELRDQRLAAPESTTGVELVEVTG
jgi:predicted RNase H-like HicB family nuclease